MGDAVYVQSKANAANWVRFTLTSKPANNGTWFQLPVVLRDPSSYGGTAPNNVSGGVTMSHYGYEKPGDKYYDWNSAHGIGAFEFSSAQGSLQSGKSAALSQDVADAYHVTPGQFPYLIGGYWGTEDPRDRQRPPRPRNMGFGGPGGPGGPRGGFGVPPPPGR